MTDPNPWWKICEEERGDVEDYTVDSINKDKTAQSEANLSFRSSNHSLLEKDSKGLKKSCNIA